MADDDIIRDISPDLQARLKLIADRRRAEEDRHEQALQDFDQEAEAVETMLELEGRLRANGKALVLGTKPLRPGANSREESEILEILSNNKDWEHTDIKGELIGRGIGRAE